MGGARRGHRPWSIYSLWSLELSVPCDIIIYSYRVQRTERNGARAISVACMVLDRRDILVWVWDHGLLVWVWGPWAIRQKKF